MKLNITSNIPPELFDCNPKDIHKILKGPTLINLQVNPSLPYLFVSTLLHGNEDSSFYLMQHLLKNFKSYHCNLLIFIGNTEAAAQGLRKLPHQPDYNRIWNGSLLPEEKLGKELLEELARHSIFACIDVHNTSGENPFYGCVNKLDQATRNLASNFSPDLIYFTEPREVLSLQLTDHYPTVVIECGKTGKPEGAQAAIGYIEKIAKTGPSILNKESFHRVYESYAILHAHPETFRLNPELEKHNFRKTWKGTLIATRTQADLPLEQMFWTNHPSGLDQFLTTKDQFVYFQPNLVPMMLTLNPQIIMDDCLCYFLREIAVD